MSQLQLTIVIEASESDVWAELSNLESHVEWMADAVALEFHSEQRRGEGTAFSCATKVGPLRATAGKKVASSRLPIEASSKVAVNS